ncbi:uncharacterized protein LOC125223592 [Salvia hispanica]|uniref:uncharacterized protein LOC125223592 n=1 Tax=Salvia hispanica TaxID=49212 RepID=UPI0020091C10|nr:uncharacterized protein LOC125223592 [Salvia hispanica]XP_047982767.1 uncharacterized protein LOC125223592 [Salvia hispanica]
MDPMSNETKVLSIRINCCDKCRNGVPKKIRKMPGVDNVLIDEKGNLVYVFGEIDGTTLLNNVAKLGKPVKLLSAADKQPLNHADENHNKSEPHADESHNESEPRAEKGKKHANCCCGDGRHHRSNRQKKKAEEKEEQKKAEEKDEHKCEDYIPPKISPHVCKDFFCKTHPRGRLITDRVPAENTSNFFGMLPFYGTGGVYQYPMGNEGWYGRQQPPPQSGYGWQQPPPRRNPQHNPFIFQ